MWMRSTPSWRSRALGQADPTRVEAATFYLREETGLGEGLDMPERFVVDLVLANSQDEHRSFRVTTIH